MSVKLNELQRDKAAVLYEQIVGEQLDAEELAYEYIFMRDSVQELLAKCDEWREEANIDFQQLTITALEVITHAIPIRELH